MVLAKVKNKFKLDIISLRYVVQNLEIEKLRLYLSLDDYFTFTKYRG
jgi:hypothetical protein